MFHILFLAIWLRNSIETIREEINYTLNIKEELVNKIKMNNNDFDDILFEGGAYKPSIH